MTVIKNQIRCRVNNKSIVWDAFFKSDREKKPLVIFCHGYKGFKDWGSWNMVAEAFSNQNLFFIKFNFSHNGGTIEDPIDFPDLEAFAENNYTKELTDLEDVLNFILSENFQFKNEIDITNITLIGHSRGGGISIIKASEDKRITKLITWASVSDYESRFGSNDEKNEWYKNGVKYVLNGRTKQQMPHNYQFFEDYEANQKRLNIQNATRKLNIPFLIIHAVEDPSVKYMEAENLHSWNSNSKLFKIENSNHVFDASHPWEKDKLPETLNLVVEKSIHFIKNTCS
ncbi:alpha/beta hydrolase fold domain-containing protein [Psychroserpens ponticola]|uniref:Alpha/beta hydrolase fold domain-containing protein n=1 Tax=Psychroserpens ponticola TaxID=2932268 RepID=A0ABY7S3H0_9FLAO|nr:alpha/beta hydrolase fold domain-containing protein [Psychroserpens ponticola]WCO03703.1 alpha/beta hydrolase fold domain-containing protein [Psychroserpens ponticola]